jgi:hypothetical protein
MFLSVGLNFRRPIYPLFYFLAKIFQTLSNDSTAFGRLRLREARGMSKDGGASLGRFGRTVGRQVKKRHHYTDGGDQLRPRADCFQVQNLYLRDNENSTAAIPFVTSKLTDGNKQPALAVVQRIHFFDSLSSTRTQSMSVLPMFSPVCDLARIQATSPRLVSRTVGSAPGTTLRTM